MAIKTIEQLRASHALTQIGENKGSGIRNSNYQKEYKSYVKALPANILQNGLGQAMAMELASGNGNKPQHKAHEKLYEHLQDWLCVESQPNSPYKGEQDDLMLAIVNNSQDKYIQAQAEAMAYLEWLKKFSVAYLKGD